MFSEFLEKLEKESSIEVTPLRKDVLKILYQAKKSMGAYDILKSLTKIRPNAKPPTVYRVLDFLRDANVIHKIESNNTYTCCKVSDHCSDTILLICEECQNMIEVPANAVLEKVRLITKKNAFEIAHSPIEINGRCADCANHE